MADQIKQGDDEIKNSGISAAEAAANESAYDNFHKELFSERDKNIQGNASESKLNSAMHGNSEGGGMANGAAEGIISKQGKYGSSASKGESGIAEGITNPGKDGGKLNGANGTAAEAIREAIREGKQQSGSIGDAIKEQLKPTDRTGNISGKLENFLKPDGVKKLPTGDYLVRDGGKETLFTPNGDKVTVNPDGTYSVKGDVKSVKTDKSGATTITFADGAQVTVDKEGIRDVSRGNESVSFPRFNKLEQMKPRPGDGRPGNGGGGRGGSELPPVKFPEPNTTDRHPDGRPDYGDRLPNKIPQNERSMPGDGHGRMNRTRPDAEQVLPNIEIRKH